MTKIMNWYGTDEDDYFVFGPYTKDHVWAGNGNDIIEDKTSKYWTSDIFHGQAGNDVLISRNGNDKLYGGIGNDNMKVEVSFHSANSDDCYHIPHQTGFNVSVHGGKGHDVLEILNSIGSILTDNGNGSYDIETRYHGHITATNIEEIVFL